MGRVIQPNDSLRGIFISPISWRRWERFYLQDDAVSFTSPPYGTFFSVRRAIIARNGVAAGSVLAELHFPVVDFDTPILII